MLKLCDKHQIVYEFGYHYRHEYVRCPVCEDAKEIDRHERENERLRMALEAALKHAPSVILATPGQTHTHKAEVNEST